MKHKIWKFVCNYSWAWYLAPALIHIGGIDITTGKWWAIFVPTMCLVYLVKFTEPWE